MDHAVDDGCSENDKVASREVVVDPYLEEERQCFKATFDHAPVGIAHIGLDGTWLRTNRGLRDLLGYSEDELRDLTFAEITHPDDLSADLAQAARLQTGEIDSYTIEKRYRRADGTYVWALLSGSVVRRADGTPSYFVSIVQNISKRKAAEAQANEELEISNHLLASFATLSRNLDVHQVCENLCDIVVALTGKSRVVVCLYEYGRRSFEVAASRNAISQPGMVIPFDNVPRAYRDVVERGTTNVIDYDSADVTDDERAQAAPFDSLLALMVPILDYDRPIGLIAIDEPRQRSMFSSRQVALVETLAEQAATALHNARDYTREQHVARTLQEAMLALPESVDGIEFDALYRAASATALVGGDFIDVFSLPNGTACVALGDVSGKGLKAASVTAVVRATIRAHALECHSPARVLDKTNSALCHFTEPSCFVTVFLGMLNPTTRELVYANGGHPNPVAVGPGGDLRTLDGSDAIVGGLPEATYIDRRFVFPEGWSAIAYSDGVSEARRDGELFGEGRIMDTLPRATDRSPRSLVERLFSEVTRYAGGRFSDDVTLLAFAPTDARA